MRGMVSCNTINHVHIFPKRSTIVWRCQRGPYFAPTGSQSGNIIRREKQMLWADFAGDFDAPFLRVPNKFDFLPAADVSDMNRLILQVSQYQNGCQRTPFRVK